MGSRLSLSFESVDFDGEDKHPRDWLAAYTKDDLERYFERYLKAKLMQRHGFRDAFVLLLDTSDPFVHTATITHQDVLQRFGSHERSNFLIRMFVRREDVPVAAFLEGSHRRVVNAHFERFRAAFAGAAASVPHPHIDQPDEPARISVIEYLYSQNPLTQWPADRTPLPSQLHPSLGLGRELLEMLAGAAADHKRDAISNRPEHFHNALLYWRVGFVFVSPAFQAYFEVLQEDLAAQLAAGFADVTRAIHAGRLVDCASGDVVPWIALEQVYPVSRRLRSFARDGRYRHVVDALKRSAVPRPYFALRTPE